ncbi:1403_t:CDS:2, partial [Scutellospora calospora]
LAFAHIWKRYQGQFVGKIKISSRGRPGPARADHFMNDFERYLTFIAL